MKFHLKADLVFEAESIDDAFDKLHQHFFELGADEPKEDTGLSFIGDIVVKPIEDRES